MKRVLIALLALATIASTDPVKDTRQIMAGTVSTTKVKNEYLSGARDSTAVFQGALSAYKAVRAAEVPPAPVPAPATVWTKCAAEGATCSVSGTAQVRYGAGTAWTAAKTITGPISCDNATWGDPAPGIVKECDTSAAAAVPIPTPSPTPAPTSALATGGYAKAIAAEQAVPKAAAAMGGTYSEAIYRTVAAGETVKLGKSAPDAACACGGQSREWQAFDLTGHFIGYLWEANLAPAP